MSGIEQDANVPIYVIIVLILFIRLSITKSVDPLTCKECVLVRVFRFNLPPTSPTLLREAQITQAYSNGDLFMAIVCRHLSSETATVVNVQ